MLRKYLLIIIAVMPFLMGANFCNPDMLTRDEAVEALEEAALSSQALILASGSVEISTNFTIGQAVEAAAEELKQFIESQLPCALITIEGAKLTIEYGANSGLCIYNGQKYSGNHTIEITDASVGSLVVRHTWSNFTNDIITVNGNATVTWSAENSSRHVVHELTWMRNSDFKTVTGYGDRTQTVIDGEGGVEGINVDGSRSWGEWNLDINNVEIRWEDPIPQGGSYSLDTPFDKTLKMAFSRVDDTRIKVVVSSGGDSFSFTVNKLGAISD